MSIVTKINRIKSRISPGKSLKKSKRSAHRRHRHINRALLAQHGPEYLPHIRPMLTNWDF